MSANLSTAERQQQWADLAIEELIRCGVTYFAVAPGSRSTPLALAVAANQKAESCVHFDERGLGFHALGYAAAGRGGVAVITTSGTAVANLLPAVIEASKKKIPLVIISADRPAELRQTGANQTIAQPGIFGRYVRWECDVPVADAGIDPAFVLTTVDQAVFRTRGELPGPVHINWMFREPFQVLSAGSRPKLSGADRWKQWRASAEPYTVYVHGERQVPTAAVQSAAQMIRRAKRGVIVVGKLSGPKAAGQVLRLAEKIGWPVLPDLSSGLRLDVSSALVAAHFSHTLPQVKTSPDAVLHLGGRITAKTYYQWISRNPCRDYFMVLNHPLRNDPGHQVSARVQACPGEFAHKLAGAVTGARRGSGLVKPLQRADKAARDVLHTVLDDTDRISEAGVVRSVTRQIPRSHAFFVSNSLPVREMDAYAVVDGAAVPVGANRGASGIDGIVASATGYAAGLNRRVTLVIGDLAMLYDVNSLALVRDAAHPLVIIVLNNSGGGIFEFLPVAQAKADYERFFVAGHEADFRGAAALFGLAYERPQSLSDFQSVYGKALRDKNSVLIEVRSDRADNVRISQSIAGLLTKKMRTAERG